VEICEKLGVLLSEVNALKDILIKAMFVDSELDKSIWASEYCTYADEWIKSPQSMYYPGNERIVDSFSNILM